MNARFRMLKSSHILVRVSVVIGIVLLAQFGQGGAVAQSESSHAFDACRWAAPLEKSGLPNLHKVSEDVYRGAQPTAEGFRELYKMGIKTVVNLRSLHSDRDELGDVPLAYREIPMQAWRPEQEEVLEFLRVVTDPDQTPVFVHCQHGADRTGVAVASYRMVVQGWSTDEAIAEMMEGGFGFHGIWINLPRFLRKLDVERIRQELGRSD
jgi:protein tyrosine phosphatase (PTP) superfamily phosphohydrolase (DUF442 family)